MCVKIRAKGGSVKYWCVTFFFFTLKLCLLLIHCPFFSPASFRIAGHSEHHPIQRQRICAGWVAGEQTSWQSVALWSRLLSQDAVPSFIAGQNSQLTPGSLSPERQNKPQQPSFHQTSGPHGTKGTHKEVRQQHKGLRQHQRLAGENPQTYQP